MYIMKRKRRLRLQVAAIILLFYVIVLIATSFVVYRSARNTYLTAKNDMIERDLTRIRGDVMDWADTPWFYDYCCQNPEKVKEPMTTAEYTIVDTLDETLYGKDKEQALKKLGDAEQLAVAKDVYNRIRFILNTELSTFDYGGLWLMDIDVGNLGFIYHNAQIRDESDTTYDTTMSSLGERFSMDVTKHPAIQNLRSGSTNTEYEIVSSAKSGDDSGSYNYIAYIPLIYDGQTCAVIGLSYNWDQFHSQLIGQLWMMTGILSVVMALSIIVLLRHIDKVALKPLSYVQRTVREYMKSKDSTAARVQLNKITAKNEIGVLSDDVSELIEEIDTYTSSIKTLTREVMEALAHTIDAKDKYTNGHSFRVAVYSRMLAKELGMSAKEQEDIYYMGLLHDIGKIGIPNVIINKTTKLTDEEYDTIKKHPVYGYEILAEIESMPELSIGARYHHERIDGKGYPDGLKGDEIPFMARIIAVADSYDTMTSNRSYRAYLPQEVVRDEIEKNIGTQFDEAPARAMLKIIDSDKSYMLHE